MQRSWEPTRCTCGHLAGDHYAKPGWPACALCGECKEFERDETLEQRAKAPRREERK